MPVASKGNERILFGGFILGYFKKPASYPTSKGKKLGWEVD
jgi:hypothetical protein